MGCPACALPRLDGGGRWRRTGWRGRVRAGPRLALGWDWLQQWGGLTLASLCPRVFQVSHQGKLKSSTGDFTRHLFVWFRLYRVRVGNPLPLLRRPLHTVICFCSPSSLCKSLSGWVSGSTEHPWAAPSCHLPPVSTEPVVARSSRGPWSLVCFLPAPDCEAPPTFLFPKTCLNRRPQPCP